MKHTESTPTLEAHRKGKEGSTGSPASPPEGTGPRRSGTPRLLDKVRSYRSAAQVRALGLYPYFRTISSAQDTEVIINGRKVLMLGSNSYLGLTNHPKIKEAAQAAVAKYGTGCAGSRFLNGTLDIHLELEQALARLVRKEAVLLYSTGFQVNLGVISALVGRGEYVIADKSDHASIVEGCLLSQGRFVRFAHQDMAALQNRLQSIEPDVGKLLVVDGVFSMEGDIIHLPELCRLAREHHAVIMVDDAHAIGVLGHAGAGTADSFGLTDDVHLIMGTFSKSLASLGGFIASDTATIDYLKHNSKPLIFSASMSPANAAAALASLNLMQHEPERIRRLWHNTERMKRGLLSLGFNLGASQTPILPVYVGDLVKTFKFCRRLEEEGVFVNPVVSPGVPPGQELLRLSLMATHTDAQIDFALDRLGTVGRELGLL
ncbi:MAG TPA: aminotransferase class I/II-fold pyridoxal phosphate-dependent enzyme [Verrucomicrobiota bacterium]|nr:aminotransferase class I/II-fold pyridoxal phosphate-dependent enzyme [Verrucomicrobiota bacterium]HNU49585.1 aminotransferase class I/II-fold pyridoxal phosphate-dependent enzyme [Verrucomicrobiota bacterium]